MRTSYPLLLFLLAIGSFGANWPNWRGPASDGSTPENDFALSWDRTNNVQWRVAFPEPGNSSPIIWEDRVFVTQAVGNRRTLWCVDRKSGAELWQPGPACDLPEETMKENTSVARRSESDRSLGRSGHVFSGLV